MTRTGSAERRSALAELTLPPWLWAWLVAGFLLGLMPAQISRMPSSLVYFFGPESSSRYFIDRGYVTTGRFFFIFAILIFAGIVAGAVAAMFPNLRGRWVERRFGLASDDRPVVAEMQRFVDSHDSSIRLRVSIRADQMARIYPVGWRGTRIAVFRPLTVLWRRDRGAAEAILLHEVAHRRQGDHLIVGLGSPFVWLMRIWVPAYLLLALIPALIYVAAGGGSPLDATFAGFQAGEYSVAIPVQILLPVTALWLAELNADRLAARGTGSGALQRALQATAGSGTRWAARALSFVSHPPRRLRLRSAEARSAGAVVLVAAWPAVMAAWALVLSVAISVSLLLLSSQLGPDLGLILKADVQILLSVLRPLAIATAVLLLTACSQLARWESGPGQKDYDRASMDLDQLIAASGGHGTMTPQREDAAIAAAFDSPPPIGRSGLTHALTDYLDATQYLQAHNVNAFEHAVVDGKRQEWSALGQISDLAQQCNLSPPRWGI